MRVGLETISWGWHIPEIRDVLSCAKTLGYDGLELAQKPSSLPSAMDLRSSLQSVGLCLAGLASAPLGEAIDYGAELGAEYVCADEWSEELIEGALDRGIRIAMHPHFYKDIDSVEAASSYLRRFPGLGLVLDTAHLHLSGEDVTDCYRRYADRVVAIHLKDWSGRYGMSPLRFARGFAALGLGRLASTIERLLELIQAVGFKGWLVVEQNTTDTSPEECARISRDWLRQRGL